ncbi:thiamine pyrophosphate-dependent enzyme [Paeniglutamicibacter kerguelensis]|uniref:Pyruvate dehydrogenase (Quinone) n=1 Tax=Paeniglutamicibacter kerguelensis TaxID=254788 RepID=A0ABS4XBA2_9MICC|nr:thiamine pyrophosphate-dependent enzyme [Paeniglutamicibacter kerguelensis]MBP2385668.1 pyruvate dehydrogenase (quinone) [Paeniglutamicibacter kerguelensis]
MSTVATMVIEALANLGVKTIWGVVGDALNPLTDAIRTSDKVRWIGVRHEEVAAFAAGAQSQLTGTLGVCMGTVGPGSIHLLNGLYDAKKSRTPVLAICGQVPSEEIGSDYFQEVNNDQLFSDVAVFARTVTSPAQMPYLLEQAVNTAMARRGVAVLSIPGNIGAAELRKGPVPNFIDVEQPTAAHPDALRAAADALNASYKVTMLVGMGARGAKDEVLATAERLAAPMVLTLKAKEMLEDGNDFQVGQAGLIGNPGAQHALEACQTLLMVGTDFPYRDSYPQGKTVIQIDSRGEHIGRRTAVDHGVVGDAGLSLAALLPLLKLHSDHSLVVSSRDRYQQWAQRHARLADPGHDEHLVGRVRTAMDNPEHAIRPEAVAAAIDKYASDSAIFTSDTGMTTVWLSRYITMRGQRRMVGSFNLGSMANAMPQALGASALDRSRQVVALCGDGGLTMLMGDLLTAVAYDLPVKLVVFNNGRLGMVKLEQEQGGLPEFGTVLKNPNLAEVGRACGLHGIRVEDPHKLDAAIQEALAHDGPVLLDVVTNPEEVSVPPNASAGQALGFGIAKIKESLASRGES